MDDLPQQKMSDNNTCHEKDQRQPERVAPVNMHHGIRSILADDIFKVLGIVAIVAWMIHEFVPDTHKVFLFTAIAFALAEGAYVMGHKILNNRAWRFLVWGLYAFCIVAIFKNEALPGSAETPKPQSLVILPPRPNFISGTEYTHDDLKNLFPFGYAIIYFSQNTRDRHEVFKTGLMEWSLDWDKTKIVPDIANGTVSWEVVIASAANPDRHQSLKDGLIVDKTDFKNGAWGMGFQFDRDQPVLYWVTLSANQQSPVFAIGCRIPTAEDREKHIIRIP